MSMARQLLVAGLVAVLVAGLGACGGGGDDSSGHDTTAAAGETRPGPETVSGLRDTVRHVSRKTVSDTRAHLVRKCAPATRRVRHTSRSGTGSHRTTRVWYSTEHYRSCKKVRQGTERYQRVVRPERWCVSLDDVNGVGSRDDVWYRVTRETYGDVLQAGEHARVEFVPAGAGC
ncbi:hypothetical protein [Streptomyces cylindrosporus]|uniref:Lipoprotein n=1 Tax=Streptomyces cylindrosporus TaxID=2927583 RepID=A0ABS9YLP4_9ACTN|nr:hypothetical protein [Streptomyces cylindrosporus]MCI3278109.1 hypothetical protein [Streptomyces cylindrosporus]